MCPNKRECDIGTGYFVYQLVHRIESEKRTAHACRYGTSHTRPWDSMERNRSRKDSPL
jgi:hypothetical protein